MLKRSPSGGATRRRGQFSAPSRQHGFDDAYRVDRVLRLTRNQDRGRADVGRAGRHLLHGDGGVLELPRQVAVPGDLDGRLGFGVARRHGHTRGPGREEPALHVGRVERVLDVGPDVDDRQAYNDEIDRIRERGHLVVSVQEDLSARTKIALGDEVETFRKAQLDQLNAATQKYAKLTEQQQEQLGQEEYRTQTLEALRKVQVAGFTDAEALQEALTGQAGVLREIAVKAINAGATFGSCVDRPHSIDR